MRTEHLIIGGGLAGLRVATRLEAAGVDWRLLDGRERLGGRILTAEPPPHSSADLGPAWFWPHQHRMAALVAELGLDAFDQFATGDALWEANPGEPPVRHAGAGTPPSLRVAGGTAALVDALASRLPADHVHTGHVVLGIERAEDHWHVRVANQGAERTFLATRLVAALPPRLLGAVLAPGQIPHALHASLLAQQTWMAAQAKFVAHYETAFWREAGLAGDAFSRAGPLVEIHDASGPDGAAPALFGFVGVPASMRARLAPGELEDASLRQLARLFGPEASRPTAVALMDWSREALTATDRDLREAPAHAAFPMTRFAEDLATLRLHLAGSEFAATEPGYLEGALEAADAALATLAPGTPQTSASRATR